MKSVRRYDLGPLDYFLAFVASSTAVYSAGEALAIPTAGFMLASISAMGFVVSYLMRRNDREPSERLTVDGVLLALTAALVLFRLDFFNSMLPGGGLPGNLLQNTFLSYMLALGSFFAWRDSTLLFQLVPAIALYGLVGAYDTYKPAPFMFFVFLLAAAGIFSRSNLRRAVLRVEFFHKRSLADLERYEWRTLAGPEWALGSAMVVIALSVMGAPVIQSVRSAAAPALATVQPNLPQPSVNLPPAVSGTSAENIRVGQGPFGKPSENPVLRIVIGELRYLRGRAYTVFEGNRWSNKNVEGRISSGDGAPGVFNVPKTLEKREWPEELANQYRVDILNPGVRNLFVPVEPAKIQFARDTLWIGTDESITSLPLPTSGDFYLGSYFPTEDFAQPINSVDPAGATPTDRAELLNFSSTPRVKQLAERAIQGAKTDFEKAKAITQLVSQTIVYNLQAAGVPDGKDAVDWVMFEGKQGYCDLYASAVAQMCRAVGLRTRVASGFLMQPGQSRRGGYLVRDRQYHLWAEVHFAETGWHVFDGTEGTREVEGQGVGSAYREADFMRDNWRVITGFGILAGVAALWAFFKFVFPVLRARTLKTASDKGLITLDEDPIKTLIERDVAVFVGRLERASRMPRQFEWTLTEYLENVQQRFAVTDLSPLSVSLNAALYAPGLRTEDQRKSLVHQMASITAAVKEARKQERKK